LIASLLDKITGCITRKERKKTYSNPKDGWFNGKDKSLSSFGRKAYEEHKQT
jgi:hypothetical protein